MAPCRPPAAGRGGFYAALRGQWARADGRPEPSRWGAGHRFLKRNRKNTSCENRGSVFGKAANRTILNSGSGCGPAASLRFRSCPSPRPLCSGLAAAAVTGVAPLPLGLQGEAPPGLSPWPGQGPPEGPLRGPPVRGGQGPGRAGPGAGRALPGVRGDYGGVSPARSSQQTLPACVLLRKRAVTAATSGVERLPLLSCGEVSLCA